MNPVRLQIALAVFGTVAGLAYAVLGLNASGHLLDEAERKSPDRFLMSGLSWSLSTSKFEAEGRSMARKANVALAIGTFAWVAWAFVR